MDLAALIHDRRMLDTFRGYDWGDPIRLWTVAAIEPEPAPVVRPRFAWADLEEELDHFRGLAVSGAVTVRQLGILPRTAARQCVRHGRHDLAVWIGETTEIRSTERKEAA